jgi:hypothetical protein
LAGFCRGHVGRQPEQVIVAPGLRGRRYQRADEQAEKQACGLNCPLGIRFQVREHDGDSQGNGGAE